LTGFSGLTGFFEIGDGLIETQGIGKEDKQE
jgi:hypothetical protein